MTSELFDRLFNGGKFSLPYLVKFSHPRAGDIFLVNNNESVEYNGNVYKVSSFDYAPPGSNGDGATLSICDADSGLLVWAENADSKMSITVDGIMLADGTITPIHNYKHFYGSIAYGDDGKIEFTLGHDDRLEMTFNPYVYDTDNNRGNA